MVSNSEHLNQIGNVIMGYKIFMVLEKTQYGGFTAKVHIKLLKI